jgi:hypothetical protein
MRRLYLTLGRFATGRDSAVIVFDSTGSVLRLETGAHRRPPRPNASPRDSARTVRFRLMRDGRLTLFQTRMWELVPSVPAQALRPGTRWTDTLAREARYEGYAQTMHGVRVSTITGDTTIEGRRFWLVRDSAAIRYRERWEEEEHTLDTIVIIERSVDGVVAGGHIYDPETGLILARSDTTTGTGTAVLQYPDGRSFRTPARYEALRHWTRYDPASSATRQLALRRERSGQLGGMVHVPRTALERRLAAGDSALRDSVIRAWQLAVEPDESERLFRLLTSWGRPDAGLDSLRIHAGDTSYLYRKLGGLAYSTVAPPADTSHVRLMIAFMEDPGLALSLGESRDLLYANLRQGLTTWPPAVTPDTATWSCTPDACRLLAEQYRMAREPRLRAVGLVALATLDPAQWSDTVLAHAERDSSFLAPVAMLVRGIGSTWRAASKASLPAPDAGWRSWLDWMNGRDPQYAAPPAAPRAATRVRFESAHSTAIRFHQQRTGRDVIGELRRDYDAAQSDSARLVLGTMLLELGRLHLGAEAIAEIYRSRSHTVESLAHRALRVLLRDSAQLADSATATALLDRLIGMTLDDAAAWRSIGSAPGEPAPPRKPILHHRPTERSIFLLSDSLPLAVRERWRSRAQLIDSGEWSERALHEPGVLYTLSSVRRAGPFVMLSVMASERLERDPGEAPRAYASMTRYYLMEFDDEWVVVAAEGWVT